MKYRVKYVRYLFILALLYGGFFSFLFFTNPKNLSIILLIVPFLLLFLGLFFTFILFIKIFTRKNNNPRLPKKYFIIAALLAAIPACLLLLDSVDQLTLKDGLLFVTFGVFVLFYINRVSFKKSRYWYAYSVWYIGLSYFCTAPYHRWMATNFLSSLNVTTVTFQSEKKFSPKFICILLSAQKYESPI